MLTLCYLLIALGGGIDVPTPLQTSQSTQLLPFQVVEYSVKDQDVRWKLWISDLIGWSQYAERTWRIGFGPLRAPYLVLRSSKERDTAIAFLKALNVFAMEGITTAGTLPNISKPSTTAEGSKRFLALLEQMDGIEISASLRCIYTRTTPPQYDATTEALVRKWIVDFEAFPAEYPKDHYLGGFARLYGLILRLQWDHDLKPLSPQFLKLKQDYPESEVIGVMADWYNTLVLCYLEPDNQQTLLKSFYSQHEGHPEWYVVTLAQKHLERPYTIRGMVSSYFCSALRRNSKGTPPPIVKRRKGNTVIFTSPLAVKF
jgi:hypothetical protein